VTGADPMLLAHDERADLADFLACLTPERWEAPTLCSERRVRNVIAHIISFNDLGPVGSSTTRTSAVRSERRKRSRRSASPRRCPSRRSPRRSGAFSRVRGLRLVATDIDWSTGNGPAVEGSACNVLGSLVR
jgi:Mycothiol maleylpyruvate isomerase N-terminal domain